MEFKKCERCGCFFVSPENICSNCHSKDDIELSTLKNYFKNSDEDFPSFNTLIEDTGISAKNLTRYLQTNNFVEGQKKHYVF